MGRADRRREIARLMAMPDSAIDFSDIPKTTAEDWKGATRGRFYGSNFAKVDAHEMTPEEYDEIPELTDEKTLKRAHRSDTVRGYNQDFALWAMRQATLLRERRYHELDVDNLIEEVESISRTEKRELSNHLEPLLNFLLRWWLFEGLRNDSWRSIIGEHRGYVELILKDSPSVQTTLLKLIEHAYIAARLAVAKDTGINFNAMPEQFPWSEDQILSSEWMPT
jgi:hypothetical protein